MFTYYGASVALTYVGIILSIPTAGAGTLTSALAAAGALGSGVNQALIISTAAKNARIYYNRL